MIRDIWISFLLLSSLCYAAIIMKSVSKYRQIMDNSIQCIELSTNMFKSGSKYYSNPKAHMGTWIDSSLLDSIIDILNDIQINTTCGFEKTLQAIDIPAIVSLSDENNFQLNLIKIPHSMELPPRCHPVGTVLLYTQLEGNSKLTTILNQRKIQEDSLSSSFNKSIPRTIRRLGGPLRLLSASNETIVGRTTTTSSCILLELALFPPRAEDGIGEEEVNIDKLVSCHSDTDSNKPLLRINLPSVYRECLLISTSQVEFEVEMDQLQDIDPKQGSVLTKVSDPIKLLQRRVGGLQTELEILIRRISYSRKLPPHILQSMGLSHVKGVLLYGPPGTGKTLIARELANALNVSNIQVVNGPEIIDKFVGEAERNLRSLYSQARSDWQEFGETSPLHMVIFDEIDAIAKRRGSLVGDGSGVRDSCVNQLLTLIDGIQESNNIITVGLTNRKDLIDPALLRPGRLEVHIEIKIPDQVGREEILTILLRPLVQSGSISLNDAVLWALFFGQEEYTEGWTGADLAGLIRSAVSFALQRTLEVETVSPQDISYAMTTSEMWQAWHEITASRPHNNKNKWVSRRGIIGSMTGQVLIPFWKRLTGKWQDWRLRRDEQRRSLSVHYYHGEFERFSNALKEHKRSVLISNHFQNINNDGGASI